MDDDDFRRGKPTVHKQYNEGIAVLVGDALLTKAFEILASVKGVHVPSLIQLLGQAAGSVGMIGGQSLDIGFEGPVTSLERLTLLHRRKTGALIEVSLAMAAVSSVLRLQMKQKRLKHLGNTLVWLSNWLMTSWMQKKMPKRTVHQVLSSCWVSQKPLQPHIMR